MKDFPDNNSVVYELLDIYLAQKEFDKGPEGPWTRLKAARSSRKKSSAPATTSTPPWASQEEGAALLEKFNEQYSSPAILSMLGDYYVQDFADSVAQVRYEEALALDSSYMPAILGMSEVYRHTRRYPEYFRTLDPFFTSEDIPAATKNMYLSNMIRSLDPKILQLHREGFDRLVPGGAGAPFRTAPSLHRRHLLLRDRTDGGGRQMVPKAADLYPESLGQTATYVQYLSLQANRPSRPMKKRSS